MPFTVYGNSLLKRLVKFVSVVQFKARIEHKYNLEDHNRYLQFDDEQTEYSSDLPKQV